MTLDARGPLHDRRWLVVDERTGAFLTQRQHPLLATVDVVVVGDDVEVSVAAGSSVRLPAQGQGPVRQVPVWSRSRPGSDVGGEAAAWFSDILGHPVRVLADAGEQGAPGAGEIAFADGYPLLIATRESLDDFNSRLDVSLPMARFRPNLVLEGASPWAEDDWQALSVSGLEIQLPKPCARCVVINTDQITGAVAPAPLRTLAGFRRRGSEGAMFGVNGVHSGAGRLRVGDTVRVTPTPAG